ncbi:MAG TPA: hypothetical protein VFA94_07415 [Acidimicrobiales bacterium]|nr:hypothetical protein [Acidimicrobiales bacterium]
MSVAMSPAVRWSRLFPWVVRLAWAALPFTAGPAWAEALRARSHGVQVVASTGLWAVWALVLVATLVPYPLGLTALRLAAPAAVVATSWAATQAGVSTIAAVAAVGTTLVVAAVAMAPATGLLFVNGSAYPNERRFPLRLPGALLVGLLPVTWGLAWGLPVAAALLLGAHRWVPGGVLAVVALAVDAVLLPALHGLSRRWVVFVPAGVVLHDPMTLADPVLFPKRTIEALRLAPVDTDSLDLTQRSPGLACELLLWEKVPLTLRKPGDRVGESGSSARLLFTPTRPGAVLAEARRRGVRG